MKMIKKYIPFILFSTVVFLLFIPLISKVNFVQNDDWNRVTSAARFMRGDFTLLSVTATTFYTQGILGMVFSYVFGIDKLPFLTLLFSVFNLCIFSITLYLFFNMNKINSFLISLLVFFNPLHVYSMIGFMTENYTLFFLLLSLFFILLYDKSNKYFHLISSNFLGVLAFLCKQNGIVLYAATIPYFLIKKRYKDALFQAVSLIIVTLAYYLLFPITNEMRSKGFLFTHIKDISYTYSLAYGIIILLASFLLPLIVIGIYKFAKENISHFSKKYYILIVTILLSIGMFMGINRYFQPGKVSWEEYPYFENTFERTGFLPRTLHGTKYQFKMNYDLYRYWDLAAKILCAVAISCLFFLRKRVVNLYSIFIAGYLLLMVFTETFFDRYILMVVPFGILFLIYTFDIKNNSLLTLIVLPFVLFLALFSTQMAYDFVYSQNYIWTKSESLVSAGVSPKDIESSSAWAKLNGIDTKPKYIFSYDSPKVNEDFRENYYLVDTYKPTYKPNLYINPGVYLYKLR
ncbi:hypothetical protein ACFLZK_00660 [Patescibacteria group bacterium]